jgi:predicted nucleic acid-binding protein
LIIVDASVIATALADDNSDGDRVRSRLYNEHLTAPEIIDIEVISVIRKALRSGSLDQRRADFALSDLADLELDRISHRPLLSRIWELRDNVTPYDAAYVALAEMIGATLVTADGRLANSTGPRCEIEFLG